MGGPLSGVRVLDFSSAVTGPFCTMLMGDLGADIIKVESAKGGYSGPAATGKRHDAGSHDVDRRGRKGEMGKMAKGKRRNGFVRSSRV